MGMDHQKDQLKSGVMLSYVNLALSSIIPLLYTPIMLRILGQQEYGLYSLANTAIGYLSLLSFGFGSTILRYLSMYRAKGEVEEERRAFGFFVALYTGIAIMVVVGGVILANNARGIFQRGLTDTELEKMTKLLLILSVSSAITFPVSVFSSVAMAHERYIFRKLVDMLSTVAVPIANLIMLYLGYASIGMAMAGLVLHAVLLPINIYYCYAVLHIRPSFTPIPRRLAREMLGFSVYVFLATIVDMLFWSTDKLLLGMRLGTAAVAVYNIGATFNGMVMSLSGAISNVMAPRVTAMVAQRNDRTELTEMFIRVGRLQYLLVALVVTGFSVFGQAFIRMWAGADYADAYWIAMMTMFPLCIPLIQNVGISIVVAQNRHAFRSIAYLVIAVINVISTALIIPVWGGKGAALCSGVAYLLGQGLVMNLYYNRSVGLDITRFWRDILRMSVIPGVMLAAGLLLGQVVTVSSWPVFFAGVALYTAIYGLGMYRFAMNDYERSLIRSAAKKTAGWLRRS